MNTELVQQNLSKPDVRHDWTAAEGLSLYNLPFNDLIFKSHSIFKKYFDPNKITLATLYNIKQAGCSEDCCFCNQSAHHNKKIEKKPFSNVEETVKAAKLAKEKGATRFCMVAACRGTQDKHMPTLVEMVAEVKKLGLETCLSAGFLQKHHAQQLKEAGLEYYNHNIETSEDFYPNICTTHKFSDRLDTVNRVAEAGIENCCGGIIGMGESKEDRVKMLMTLANLPKHPKSIPINRIIKFDETPAKDMEGDDDFDLVRTVAIARIMMPKSFVRFSAGRQKTSEAIQALCYFAGVNSIHFGNDLLTSPNQLPEADKTLFAKLGLEGS
jgi:biotin synthase